WHKVGKPGDYETQVSEQEQTDPGKEGQDLPALTEPLPTAPRDGSRQDRHWPEKQEIRQREPARGDALADKRRPDADECHEGEHDQDQRLRMLAGTIGKLALSLHYQPCRAEQTIPCNHTQTADEGKWCRPVERAASILAIRDFDPLNEPAKDHA